MQQEVAHRRLFDHPHPRRSRAPFHAASEAEIALFGGSRLCHAWVVRQVPDTLGLTVVGRSLCVAHLAFELGSTVRHSHEIAGQLPRARAPVFASWVSSLLSLDRDAMAVTIFEDSEVTQRFFLQTETDLIAFAETDSVIFCPTTTAVAIVGRSKPLCETQSPIVLLAVSPLVWIFALATLDGAVAAYSLHSGRRVLDSHLGYSVTHLVITRTLGFIVAFGYENISILSVNAELIKSVGFPSRVVKVYEFTAFNGFDFVAFETEQHQIGFFEAFFPDNIVIFCQVAEPTVCIAYAELITAFVLVLEDGTVKIVGQKITINAV
jgi:hypothetical protein